jgi:unsaturated rhamnogalacturonyl hydrolase
MKKIFSYLFLILVLSRAIFCQTFNKIITSTSFSTTPWSIRMAESEMKRNSNYYSNDWNYVPGTVLKGIELLWRKTGDDKYYQYIKNTIDQVISSSGSISGYRYDRHSLDEINEGRMALLLYKETSVSKYKIAIDTLRAQLRTQPRTYDGGFWHRDDKNAGTYPHQMWLDGLYMANPFYAEYGMTLKDTFALSDVVTQLTVMEKHARDSTTGLLYHGWDESKTQAWADSITGCSPSFWGRGDGWYAMAAVDVLDYLPADHPGREKIIAIIQRLAEALKKVQAPESGTWWQVLDMGGRDGNYLESSASCMFVYALAKSVRLGYIDKSYWDVVKKGYPGLLNEFIKINSDSSINLINTCAGAGLGGNPYRSGTYDYYVYQTSKSTNDGKATGPFIMASLEVENAGLVVPPLNFTSTISQSGKVLLTWKDMSYNAVHFIIERRKEDEQNFAEIAQVQKGIVSFVDSTIQAPNKYFYRARVVSGSNVSDYSNVDSIEVIPTSVKDKNLQNMNFKLYQNYPNPFNPETKIDFRLNDAGKIRLSVFDILGNKVATLIDGYEQSGFHSINFKPSELSSGVYFYKLRTNNFIAVKKMILLR